MPAPYTIQELSKIAGDFVIKKRGEWNHDDWEQLCADVSALGLKLDGEMQVRLGLLIETLKAFYVSMPKRISTASAKSKTRAKRKVKAKAKAKPGATPGKKAGE